MKMRYFRFLVISGLLMAVPAAGRAEISSLLTVRDVSGLEWKLWGYRPNVWRMNFNFESLSGTWAEIQGIDAAVPGSVRNALKKAGFVPDWNIGLDYTASEWVENRHWLFTAEIPDEWAAANRENAVLRCHGLDYKGLVMINGREAGRFENAFIPYDFPAGKYLKEKNNTLVFVFECPPENLAQIGWTSKIRDWKPRFNFGWDWVPRIVQTGVWDKVEFVVKDGSRSFISGTDVVAGALPGSDKGNLTVKLAFDGGKISGKVHCALSDDAGKTVREGTFDAAELPGGIKWDNLKIKRWHPNGNGDQPLYRLNIELMDETGGVVQQAERRIGFRHIEWRQCEGAADNSDPWICVVNGNPTFLQGVNWTPVSPLFADLKDDDYRRLLTTYRDLGLNIIRVWGGGFPEKEWLYDLCDEMGILVWQEFPLSSSGLDNYPPEGAEEILAMNRIAEYYVTRLRHHASLLLWSAGNELYEKGDTAPITDKHPLIGSMKKQILRLDPTRKFVPGSPSGPAIYAGWDNFGSGNNWDVHGPWTLPFKDDKQNMDDVREFWGKSDALFHSEVGVPGAMSAEMIRKYAGIFNPLPADLSNPLWRTVNWWIDWDQYLSAHGGQAPASLEQYVEWSQQRQSEGLVIALKSCKNRFPRCGGFIIWMGHDCFPCPVNTSIIDFEGNPKPAALEISKVWKKQQFQ
jgi:beta-mannosidase